MGAKKKLYNVHGLLMSRQEQMAFDKFIATKRIALNTKSADDRLALALEFIEKYHFPNTGEKPKNYDPQYKELRFATEADFQRWLKKAEFVTIRFEEQGHDLIQINVHKTGEILQTDMPSLGGIYNGCFVNMNKLVIGQPVEIYDREKQKFTPRYGLLVETLDFKEKASARPKDNKKVPKGQKKT